MAVTKSEMDGKLDEVKTALTNYFAAVDAAFARLEASIGTPVDYQAESDILDAAKTDLLNAITVANSK